MDSLTEFNLDLMDEIDDKEFAIPSIDGPLPTLESILNEEDNPSSDSDLDLDQNDTNNGIDSALNEFLDSIENSSLSSFGSKSLKPSPNALQFKDRKLNRHSIEGSVIRHSVLKSLSAQLSSANTDRINAGKPTVLTISNSYVAVGTSHGFVLVFDNRQIMKSCLRINEDSGSVSAMAIKKDNSRILCGYSRGNVSLWSLQSGELIKIFNDLHSPNTTVLHLKYLSDNNFGALSDSSGSVFMLDFRRKEVDSQCIFSGSRGEVLTIEPLLVSTTPNKEVANFTNSCLLSMATVTKVIALSVRPSIVVHFTHVLKGELDTLPLLCWQFVMVQVSEDNRVIDPVLSFGRQNNIYFFQASFKTSSKILFTPLMQITVGYIIQSMVWLNSRTMVTIDEFEKMHVIDVRSEEEIEVIEIDKIQMVYASALFKSIDNGTNVSPAMRVGAKRACYHSICVSNSSLSNTSSSNLLILGISSVHLFSIRSWTERIDLLVNEKKFAEALALCLSFYKNTAKAVIGLSGKKSEKKKFVSQKMVEVLNNFVDSGLTSLCPENGKIESLFDHFKQLIPMCVDYCLSIESNHFLLNDLFDRFSDDSIAKNIFLDSLEPHILKGELKNLNPILAKELIIYYENKKWFHNLESIVLNLEITSLDIHHVMTICQKHNLFDAIIYIHNNAFDDYMTPFDQLIQKLRLSLNNGNELNDNEIGIGNKLLDYMGAILRGRSYPNDKDLEPQKKLIVIREIISRITRTDKTINSNHNLKAFAADIYPNLTPILKFNSKHFLTLLLSAFESFDYENSYLMSQKQEIVDILVQVMVESPGFNDKQIGALFIFIAKLLSNKRNTLSINNTLMDQVLEYLFQSEDVLWFEERQEVLLELLQSDNLLAIDQNKVLEMAKKANFFRICEYIYVKNRNWGENLSCYIFDQNRKSHVFNYIQQILLSSNLTEDEKRVFKEFIYSKIDCLTEIDNKKTAKLVLNDLDIDRFEEIINSLKTNPKVLYKLLFGILLGTTSKTHKRDPSTGSISFESLSIKEQRKQTLITDPKIQEKFIQLMSEFEPKYVFKTLNILEDYRSDVVLVYCKNSNISEATAYLLEKTSRFEEAFNLLYKDLDQMIKELKASEIEKAWNQIETQMIAIIDFCRRTSFKITETIERDNFWLSLINSMVTINQLIKSSAETQPIKQNICNDLNKLMNKLIESINNTTNLTSIMETVINDPSLAASGGNLYHLRDLFTIVYENYNYEETLLLTTNNLLLNELHQHFIRLKKDVNKGNTNRYKTCGVCSKPLLIGENILFHCSHSFHHKCVDIKGKPPKCQICEPLSDNNSSDGKTYHRLSFSNDSTQTNDSNIDQKSKSFLQLSESQMKTLEYLRSGQRIDSRAKILNQLPNTRIQVMTSEGPTDDIFKLKLAPDWRQIIN